MSYRAVIAPAVFVLAAAALIALILSGLTASQAVQNPTMAIDMVTTGNSYDDTTNTMTVGSTENCSTSATNIQHQHSAHLVIKNVEDLIGWQARVNYLGDKMRPSTVNFAPFADTNLAQSIAFPNLAIDQSTFIHRDLVTASNIPAAAASSQTAAFGSTYSGVQGYAISPDSPAKTVPDDSSYSSPSGGVLATVLLQVIGDQTGNQLFMNLDDGSPNAPASGIAYFDGIGSQTLDLPSSALGDGFHAEGVACVPQDCTNVECPPACGLCPTPSPTLSPTPTPGTPTPTLTPTPTPTCTPVGTGQCPTLTVTPTLTRTATPSPTCTCGPTPTPTLTLTPTLTPTVTATTVGCPAPGSPSTSGTTERVSIATGGAQGNSQSDAAAVSADGRFVAFSSASTNLVQSDTNGAYDVFGRDRLVGTTARVSVATGGAQGNGDSFTEGISSDGRFVLFESDATNLVLGDTNAARDAFVHDRQTGLTERISVAGDGTQGNASSFAGSITTDGRFVTFGSYASNLVAGDTNGFADGFVRDRLANSTERTTVASDGTQGNDISGRGQISGDGRFVTFYSAASNLVPGDTNGAADGFVRDRQASTTERVTEANDQSQGNGDSFPWSLSSDGRLVGFSSLASNLVAGDTNGVYDAFVRDRQTSVTERVSVASDGTQGIGESAGDALVSGDARFVAFRSSACNLVPGDTNGSPDVFVRDRQTGTTERASVASDGTQGNSLSQQPDMSVDGRFVAFDSLSTNLVPGDNNGVGDVFLHDRFGTPPSPTPTPTPTPTPSPATPTPTLTPTPTPTPTLSPTPTPTCTPVGTGQCPSTPTPTLTVTPTPSPTPTPTPTVTSTPVCTTTSLSTDCPTPPPTATCTPSGTGQCPTPSSTLTPTPTPTTTATPTPTCTPVGTGQCPPTPTVSPTVTVTPTVTPTPTCSTCTPTPTPTPPGHDSRLSRISGLPRNVRLSAGIVVNDTTSVTVVNQSAHTDLIGVYVDAMAPAAGGCTPNGRVLETTITLAAGAKTTLSVPVIYSCLDPAAANDLSFIWVAVADHGADDLASCGVGNLQSVACFDALADDDQDPADNRATRNGPRVVAQ